MTTEEFQSLIAKHVSLFENIFSEASIEINRRYKSISVGVRTGNRKEPGFFSVYLTSCFASAPLDRPDGLSLTVEFSKSVDGPAVGAYLMWLDEEGEILDSHGGNPLPLNHENLDVILTRLPQLIGSFLEKLSSEAAAFDYD